jgi:hypothetical protein
MSTMPWGTMNGWLRLETEQRGTWLQQRVQDLRAAQVTRPSENAYERPTLAVAERKVEAVPDCPVAEGDAVAEAA